MSDAYYYPDFWREYCKHCKKAGKQPDREWALFASRFRMAGNFGGAVWFGRMTLKTTRGYDAALRLMLCYGAMELACAASKQKIENIKLEGDYLADCRRLVRRNFSSFSREEFNLRGSLTSVRLKRKLDDFFSEQSDDLMAFAAAVRHLFAHGVWTPKGSIALTKSATEGLDWISHGLKLEAQKLFVQFVQGLMKTEKIRDHQEVIPSACGQLKDLRPRGKGER